MSALEKQQKVVVFMTIQSLSKTIKNIFSELNNKQNAISDLSTIRNGASKGATALQSIPAASSSTLGGIKIQYSNADIKEGSSLSSNTLYIVYED